MAGEERKWPRRAVVGGAGAAAIGTAAAFAYRAAPVFWQQYTREMRRRIAPPAAVPDWRRWSEKGVHAAWLGHATVLLQIDGYRILTDPVFSNRCGVGLGPVTLGLKRRVAPALRLSDLPHIDLILLSHAHMDHWDIPSLRKLESNGTLVITANMTSDLLRAGRYRQVTEIGWGEKAQAGPLSVRAFEVNHWGARMRTDTYRGYNGYLLEMSRYRVLFAGDTAETGAFRRLHTSRPVDLAIMPIGAYNPWIRYHCNPEQAWRMGNDAGAEFLVPIHHQTFELSREPYLEPIERFVRAAGPHPDRVGWRRIGQQFSVA